ncbi:hypothetical protein [Streptomyces sp. NPDC005281]|uniref:hypothetical protein n=1 Tax=Streptomyces sp. NPDC005281 TaxID=3155712 RepID=UPI0033A7D771
MRVGVAVGVMGDSAILKQGKKAQGETNARLDALLEEQRRTNQLLAQLLMAVQDGTGQQAAGPAWGRQV